MKTYTLRAFTGPALVSVIADKCREAGVNVDIVGTEHIFIQMRALDREYAKFQVGAALVRKHNTHFGLIFR